MGEINITVLNQRTDIRGSMLSLINYGAHLRNSFLHNNLRHIQQKCDFCLLIVAMESFMQRQPGVNPSGAAWHCQTSSIITDSNSDPIFSSIIPSPPASSQHITFVLTEPFPLLKKKQQKKKTTSRLTRKEWTNTLTSLTAYSSGVTFSTSNTTASKLFFRSEEPLSLRDSELLLF